MPDGCWTLTRAGVEITRLPLAPATVLRVRQAQEPALARVAELLGGALPLRPGAVTAVDGGRLCWLAPGEWLLLDLAPPGDRLAGAFAPAACHIADLGEAYVRFRISGMRAPAVLAKGTSLDLARLIAGGGVARTRFAQIHTLFDVPVAGEPTLELLADITYAEHLQQWFNVATLDQTAEGTAP
jgi:sarcosine oxidase subunit gamma